MYLSRDLFHKRKSDLSRSEVGKAGYLLSVYRTLEIESSLVINLKTTDFFHRVCSRESESIITPLLAPA